jgi:hypothetical protein
MAHVDLLAAAFSALLGVEVVSPTKAVALGQHDLPAYSIHQLFRATHIPVCADNHVVIQRLTGENFIIPVSEGHTIADVKAAIHAKEGIHPDEQWLLHERQMLEDRHVLQERGVRTNSVILCCDPPGGQSTTYIPMIKIQNPERDLDPSYDYDFTNRHDDGETYTRGKYPDTAGSGWAGKPIPYYRPYGWKRYALKVLGRYGGNDWIGSNGIRTETDSLEWPVSYHGTKRESVPYIVPNKEGEGLRPGSRNLYGVGVYSSPFIKTASGTTYAEPFEYEGKRYQVVLQNRLIAKGCRIYRKGDSDCPGSGTVFPDEYRLVIIMFDKGNEYYITPHNAPKNSVYDIRPYGILIKQL